MKIKFDSSLLGKHCIGDSGIVIDDTVHVKYANDFGIVTANLHKSVYGYTAILENNDVVDSCMDVYKQIEWAKNLVVIGIGGSDLGGRMLQEALQADMPPMNVFFVGDTTDPEQYRQLFQKINAKETVVNVISKSGSTTETMAGYLILKKYIHDHIGDAWPKHFVFTTSLGSLLAKEAEQNNILTLDHDDVGGRYSVLAKVGLFPALAMGIDIAKLVDGGRKMVTNLKEVSQKNNVAWLIALSQYIFSIEKDIDTVVLMPYIWRLSLFGNWFRQLMAESIGKDGKGILPIKAVGPADQHSQLQFYTEGKWLSTFLFVSAKHYGSEIVVESEESEEFNYFHHIPMEDVVKYECEATRFSLANSARPSARLEINCLDEEHLGALIVLFETAVVYLAQLLDVNPFDQPGVEESKHFLYGMLGRKEYFSKVEEMEKMRKKMKSDIVEIE